MANGKRVYLGEKVEPIAVYSISNFGGYGIFQLDDEKVVYAQNYGEGWDAFTEADLVEHLDHDDKETLVRGFYDAGGDFISLDDFMRV